MQRQWRRALSAVLVLSMMLSMTAVFGTVATATNERREYITSDKVATYGADIVADGKGWTLTKATDCADPNNGDIVATIGLNDAAMLQQLKYLVIKMSDTTNATYAWMVASATKGGVYPFGSWSSESGWLVCDMTEVVAAGETAMMYLYFTSDASSVYAVEEMYLTDVAPLKPKDADKDYVTTDMLKQIDGYYANTVSSHNFGLGFTLTLDETNYNGARAQYFHLTDMARLSKNRYLVIDVSASTDALFAVSHYPTGNAAGNTYPGYAFYWSHITGKPNGILVYDLGTATAGLSDVYVYIELAGAAGQKFVVNEMYLTDTDPTVSAEFNITADMLLTDSACFGSEVTAHPDGLGWDIVLSEEATDAKPIRYFALTDMALVRSKKYLVIEIDASTDVLYAASHSPLGTSVNGGLACSWQGGAATVVYNLGDTVASEQYVYLFLWMIGAQGQKLSVNRMYLTDTDPNAAETPTVTTIPLASFAPGLNNMNITALGEDGLGLSLAAPWNDDYPYGYTSWKFTTAQIQQTPYLVLQNSAATYGNIGSFFSLTHGYLNAVLTSFPGTDLYVVDLREFDPGDNELCLSYIMTGTIEFEKAYLTNTKAVNLPLQALADKSASLAVGDPAAPVKNGAYGYSFSSGFFYYELSAADVAARPYLIYKFKKVAPVVNAFATAQGSWNTNLHNLASEDTFHHVYDLTADSNYSDQTGILLQLYFSQGVEFEYIYFACSPDILPEQIQYHEVFFKSNGGTTVYTQRVPNAATLDPVVSTLTGYNGSWYTDAALTQAFDFATPIEQDMTLYAKWTIANYLSPVFGQLSIGTTNESESAAIRFVAAIDSLDAARAGIVVSLYNDNPTVGAERCIDSYTNTVWTSIIANGSEVTAQQLNGSYIFGCTVNNIPNAHFATNIYVRAYLKLRSGQYVYTDTKVYTVNAMIGK